MATERAAGVNDTIATDMCFQRAIVLSLHIAIYTLIIE